MAVRASFEKNNEVGCFAKLTNTYCLVAIGGNQLRVGFGCRELPIPAESTSRGEKHDAGGGVNLSQNGGSAHVSVRVQTSAVLNTSCLRDKRVSEIFDFP
uniref:Eukaryotic translation initiation factor 6 n=1 Tax=Oryzias sinensis TaxID=183150 RepID=A0A8C7X6W4_9TELE